MNTGYRNYSNRRQGDGGYNPPDQIYCSVHGRKRLKVDLMSTEDGRWRCLPNKECRQDVVCRLHGRRRNPLQMRQVEPGVFECSPPHECRTQLVGQRQRLGGRPVENAASPSMNAWAPVSSAKGGEEGQPPYPVVPGMRRDREGGALPHQMPIRPTHVKQVWCSRHGKRLPETKCVQEEELCHICSDSSECLSTPLDLPADLLGRACEVVLCSRHNALRSVGFVELSEDRSGYRCVPGHRCRYPTLLGQTSATTQKAPFTSEKLAQSVGETRESGNKVDLDVGISGNIETVVDSGPYGLAGPDFHDSDANFLL